MRFDVDFKGIVFQFMPHFLRKPNLLRLIFSGVKPLQKLNNDGVVVESFGQKGSSLFQFTRFINNFLRFDARTNLLEKFLNIIYDPTQERIKIVNNNQLEVLFLFNNAEEVDPVFFYNNWDPAVAYKINTLPITGDFVYFENKIFQAKTDNTNKQPDLNPSDWDFFKNIDFLFNNEDEFQSDYVVEIPLDVTLQPNFTTERITSQINLLNAAGRTFELKTV